MGTAWHSSERYPWEEGTAYDGGIETVKVNLMLRIYSNKWHVYAGLAILNPSAKTLIHQFAQSATDLFKLMIQGDENGLRKRVLAARAKVFDFDEKEGKRKAPILLSESMLDRFSRVLVEQLSPLPPRHGRLLGGPLHPPFRPSRAPRHPDLPPPHRCGRVSLPKPYPTRRRHTRRRP